MFKLVFCLRNRYLAELLEVLHEFKGSLAGPCSSSFVAFYDLRIGILLEEYIALSNFLNEIFHCYNILVKIRVKSPKDSQDKKNMLYAKINMPRSGIK